MATESAKSLKVFLVDSKLRKHCVDVDDSARISHLKAILAKMSLVPAGFTPKLVYQLQILNDDDSFRSIGYSPGSSLSLVCVRVPPASSAVADVDPDHRAAASPAASGDEQQSVDLLSCRSSLPMPFQLGSRVSVSGLVAAKQHNGKTGTVCSHDDRTGRFDVMLDEGGSLKIKSSNLVASVVAAPHPSPSSSAHFTPPNDDFPRDGLSPTFFREFIDANGGEAAFKGLTTSNVKRQMIVPATRASESSLCAQMRQEGDPRVQPATWFVSHPWQIMFLDLVSALESFFEDKPGAIIWLDLISTSQHATFDQPPEWWQHTFCTAIGQMGQMVMVMTPWDNPVCLTRAWCLIELYACRSSGSHFCVALPPSERARFVEQIAERGAAFYDMLSKVNTAKSECSRDADRDRIFEAVRGLDGGFVGLDRSVLKTLTEWLQRQLEVEIAGAVACERHDTECKMMSALGGLFKDKGEFDRALPLYQDCLVKRKRILGDEHPDTLASINNLAGLLNNKGEFDRALPLYQDCLMKRKRILGEEHPDTLITLNRLAQLFYNKGDCSRALSLHQDCLAKRKRTLGDDHPETLASLNNLAGAFLKRGDYDRALPLFEECLTKQKRILGDDHPRTLAATHNFAGIIGSRGQFDRAVELLQECVAKHKRILGDNHPSTLSVIKSLANTFRNKGDFNRALPLYEEYSAKSKHLLGTKT